MDYTQLFNNLFGFASVSVLGFCTTSIMFGYYASHLLQLYMRLNYNNNCNENLNIYEINYEITDPNDFICSKNRFVPSNRHRDNNMCSLSENDYVCCRKQCSNYNNEEYNNVCASVPENDKQKMQ